MPETYSYKSPKTGKTYDYDWTKPIPPTPEDFKTLEKMVADEEAATPTGKSHGIVADTVWNFGKRIKDVAVGMADMTAVVQGGNFQKEYAESQKSPEAWAAFLAKTKEITEAPFNAPVKSIASVMQNVVDPMGITAGTYGLGKQAITEDIPQRNWGGLAANTILASLPLLGLLSPKAKAAAPKPRLALPPGTSPKLLPAIGETTAPSPRFYSGPAGVADANISYPYDITDFAKQKMGGTLSNAEMGTVVDIGPELAAGRTTAVANPFRVNPVMDALLPDRYKPDRMVPLTNPLQGLTKDVPKITQEWPEGGVIPKRVIPSVSRDVLPNIDPIGQGSNLSLKDALRVVEENKKLTAEVLAPPYKKAGKDTPLKDVLPPDIKLKGDEGVLNFGSFADEALKGGKTFLDAFKPEGKGSFETGNLKHQEAFELSYRIRNFDHDKAPDLSYKRLTPGVKSLKSGETWRNKAISQVNYLEKRFDSRAQNAGLGYINSDGEPVFKKFPEIEENPYLRVHGNDLPNNAFSEQRYRVYKNKVQWDAMPSLKDYLRMDDEYGGTIKQAIMDGPDLKLVRGRFDGEPIVVKVNDAGMVNFADPLERAGKGLKTLLEAFKPEGKKAFPDFEPFIEVKPAKTQPSAEFFKSDSLDALKPSISPAKPTKIAKFELPKKKHEFKAGDNVTFDLDKALPHFEGGLKGVRGETWPEFLTRNMRDSKTFDKFPESLQKKYYDAYLESQKEFKPRLVKAGKAVPPPPTEDLYSGIKPSLPPQATKALREFIDAFKSEKPAPTPLRRIPTQRNLANPVNKVIQAMKDAKEFRVMQDEIIKQTRIERMKKAEGITTPGVKGLFEELAALSGEMEKVKVENLERHLTRFDRDSLVDMVKAHPSLSFYEKIRGRKALTRLFYGERVPPANELAILERVFGKEFTGEIQNLYAGVPIEKIPTGRELVKAGIKASNTAKSISASYDVSAPFRQGLGLVHKAGFWKGFEPMIRSLASEKYFDEFQAKIHSDPYYKLAEKHKLALTDLKELTTREEAFHSEFAERYVPGVKASNRAFISFLNKARLDTFKSLVKKASKSGKLTPEMIQEFADFVNNASGRGNLGALEQHAVVLNGLLFSPRLIASRARMINNIANPASFMKLSKQARIEYWKSAAAIATTSIVMTNIAEFFGGKTTNDPRSSDFRKSKFGEIRLDPGGGFQQFIVGLARFASNQTVGAYGYEKNLGEGYKADTRWDILQRFGISKASPLASFLVSWMKGTDFKGDKLDSTGLAGEAINKFIPLVLQDLYDIASNDPEFLPLMPLAALGMGLQNYKESESGGAGGAIARFGKEALGNIPMPKGSFIPGDIKVPAPANR